MVDHEQKHCIKVGLALRSVKRATLIAYIVTATVGQRVRRSKFVRYQIAENKELISKHRSI